MLTATLRGLERDGVVSRTVHPINPPRVEYALTGAGQSLLLIVRQLCDWTTEHIGSIRAARSTYDLRVAERSPDEVDHDTLNSASTVRSIPRVCSAELATQS